MHFNSHSELEGKHARLSASNYHWIGYDIEKFERHLLTQIAAARGTRLHDLAAKLIRERIKVADTTQTFNMYVNDCIGWGMTAEQVLFVSENAFGTADAISFRDMVLRISDLKTGENPASFTQLLVYAAFFCLEYNIKPAEILIEMRIYQNDEVYLEIANPVDVTMIMSKTIAFDKFMRNLVEEGDR